MKQPIRRSRSALAALLVLCLLLSGCAASSILPEGGSEEVVLPEPGEATYAPAQEDQMAACTQEARLYYPTADGRDLAAVTRTVTSTAEKRVEEQVLELLLSETPTGLSPVAPEGASIRSLTISCGVATVDLSLSVLADEQAVLRMQSAIGNTLASLAGVEAVNLLLDGRKTALRGLSAGLTRLSENSSLSAQWSQLLADEELMSAASITREAAVYYLGREGEYLAPQIRTVTLSGGNPVGDLLSFMQEQPEESALRAALSQEDLLAEQPKLLITAGGERIVKVVFAANSMAAFESRGLAPWQVYAALTLTLTGFVPELDGVCVYVGEGQVLRTACPIGELVFPGGIMHRDDFTPYVGERLTVLETGGDGLLAESTRLVNLSETPATARGLISATLDGPEVWETGLTRVAPEGVSGGELLGVTVGDGRALVNFSARFYEACQALSAAQERNLAYALVNSLCTLPEVRSVCFQREGQAVEYLAGSVYLRVPLIPNPGLVSEGAQAENLIAP